MTASPAPLRSPLVWLYALWTASVVPWLAFLAPEALFGTPGPEDPEEMGSLLLGLAFVAWTAAMLVAALALAVYLGVKGGAAVRARAAAWFAIFGLGVVAPLFATARLAVRWQPWVTAWLLAGLAVLAIVPVVWAVRDLRAWRGVSAPRPGWRGAGAPGAGTGATGAARRR